MFWKKTDILGKIKNLDSLSKLKSYLGKKVYSKKGDNLGYVKDVMFKGNIIQGILVKGKRKLFISKEFIEKGYDADIIVFDDDINIIETMVMGNFIL